MTPRARRRATVAGSAAAVLALAGCGLHNPDAPASTATRSTPASRPATAASTAASTAAAINRQDHPPAALERSQAATAAERPLLPALPLATAGVTITVGGLAPDGRTTILTVTSPHGGRAHALTVYHALLRRYGDSGRAYQPQVVAP